MVDTHCVRDKGTNGTHWLIRSDWLRVRVSPIRLVHTDPQPFSKISGKLLQCTLGFMALALDCHELCHGFGTGCHGFTAMPWDAMALWHCHGTHMECHGTIMELSGPCHGTAMISRDCHGMPWDTMGLPWEFHDDSTAPWYFYGMHGTAVGRS